MITHTTQPVLAYNYASGNMRAVLSIPGVPSVVMLILLGVLLVWLEELLRPFIIFLTKDEVQK